MQATLPTSTNAPCCMDIEFQANIFKALGHPVRLKIVRMLLDTERCVCDLHTDSDRDMSTISSHLKILRNAQIITSRQEGKRIYYSLSYPCLRSIFTCLDQS